LKKFPCGKYGRQNMRFFPAPFKAPLRAFAALVFPWQGREALLCDIEGRGWCIPSGRVEPYETSIEAAKREAVEEAGAVLEFIQYIGCYQISERGEVRWADCFTARVAELGEFQADEESRARKLVPLEELPEVYHLWNELTEQVFLHSLEVLERFGRQTGRE
jgi:8-oxo-dGTP diphosphatase